MAMQQTKLVDAIKLTDFENKPMDAYYIESKSVDTKFGEQPIHLFQKEDGTKISVWGFTALNRLLEHTPKGVLTKITYTGKTETSNKYGNKSHTCTVFFDTDKKLDGFTEVELTDEEKDELPF